MAEREKRFCIINDARIEHDFMPGDRVKKHEDSGFCGTVQAIIADLFVIVKWDKSVRHGSRWLVTSLERMPDAR